MGVGMPRHAITRVDAVLKCVLGQGGPALQICRRKRCVGPPKSAKRAAQRGQGCDCLAIQQGGRPHLDGNRQSYLLRGAQGGCAVGGDGLRVVGQHCGARVEGCGC